jgi:glycosyltransferase involved in cell wall biosynthesis
MRIGFDARMIDHPGIGRYIKNLLGAMLRLQANHEFILFGNREKLSVVGSKLSVCKVAEYNAPIYSLSEQLFEPFSSYNLDILLCPHFNIPYFYKGNLVVTIHDLIYLIIAQSAPSKPARIYANIMISRAIKKAKKILAVSENTKNDLLKFFKPVNPNEIDVIYEAADPSFRVITDKDKLSYIKEKYNLPDKYVLFVGSLKYHKNLNGAVKAFLELSKKIKNFKLVIVGRFHKREYLIERMLNSSGALYIGEVSSEDLVGIYNMASALLHLSLYEGFGLTILEAMACGVPVVCSKTPALLEIGQDAALQVDADNTAAAAQALYDILTNKDLRNSLIDTGFKRVKEFSWERAAEKTLKLCEQA